MELPEFPEAVDKFKICLKKERLNTDLIWIFREDVVNEVKNKVYLTRISKNNIQTWEGGNEWLSKVRYEYGRQRNLGLEMTVHCFLDSRPLCYIWLPKDDEQAQYRMIGKSSLKFTIPTSRQMTAKIINPFDAIIRLWPYRVQMASHQKEALPMKTRLSNFTQEGIENRTILLRSGSDQLWKKLRELILEKGIDPQTALLVDCFQDDVAFDYGVLITDSKKIFQFGLDYLHKPFRDGLFSEWNDITESFQDKPEARNISIALGMVPLKIGADLEGMFTSS